MANSKHGKANSIDVSSSSLLGSSKGLSGNIKLHMAPLLKYKSLRGNDASDRQRESLSADTTSFLTTITSDRPPQIPPHTPTTPTFHGTDIGQDSFGSPRLPGTPTIRAVTEPGSTAAPLKVTTSTSSSSSRHRSHSATSSPASTHLPQMIPEGREAPSPPPVPPSPAESTARVPPPRPGGSSSRRSASQEKNFLNKIKKGRDVAQEQGTKAVGMLNKFGHGAWDKFKTQRERLSTPKSGGGYGRSSSPQNLHRDHSKRDKKKDVEVFGMKLKDAVEKTRVQKERKGEDIAFWIPAIAYRCIQYLNVHGPKEVGVYRVPGSTAVVDELRAEFVMYHDVDLFENPPNDLHTVSSLLKSYLRSLPEPVIPKDVQTRMYERCKDHADLSRPPTEFIEELSKLPPYNYYLLRYLFSHLSAVNDASGINKMNIPNLAMIFCPTLRMDRFAFNWLAGNFNMCWTMGCVGEEEEYLLSSQNQVGRRPSHASVASSSLAPPLSAGSSTMRPDTRGTEKGTTTVRPATNGGETRPPTSPSPGPQKTPAQSSASSSPKPTATSPKTNGTSPTAVPAKPASSPPPSSPPSPSPISLASSAPKPQPSTTGVSKDDQAVIKGLSALHLQSSSPPASQSGNKDASTLGAGHARSDSMIVQTGRLSVGNPLDAVPGNAPIVEVGGRGET
ncbi:RhoGAP-domain-containing protein [Ascodesmis nigricans]|uniref:RhoGAP-domain-containing protein n=1 Tax=Ascodesmis nigricans TaxID=341454 RepID=A0A4S2MSX5_9PEZI|nr:RhoGAP-domain-containing protein [Ascodesmis nigricans]